MIMDEPRQPDPGFDAAGLAKHLLRTIRSGALATLGPDGVPFATLVTVATDPDGSPLLLTSRLSGHTANMEREPRVSILLAQTGKGDPLEHPPEPGGPPAWTPRASTSCWATRRPGWRFRSVSIIRKNCACSLKISR